jgi:hypothetical protein
VGCGECGDEPAGSGTMELVRFSKDGAYRKNSHITEELKHDVSTAVVNLNTHTCWSTVKFVKLSAYGFECQWFTY